MDKIEKYIILITLLLSIVLCVGLPYWIWKVNGNSTIIDSETIQISGKVSSILKTETSSGRYGKPVIYINIEDKPYKFRIGGSAYRAINSNKITREIRIGDLIEIDTKSNELERSKGYSLLNKIFKWRGQPMIYGLRKKNKSYLTISQYNSSQENFNSNNFSWGIIFLIYIVGYMVWINKKEKINLLDRFRIYVFNLGE